MSLLQSITAAFKGADTRVPLARSFMSPWAFADAGTGIGTGRPAYEYAASVRRAYLENPVAQRAVRLLAEGIGGAPLLPADPRLIAPAPGSRCWKRWRLTCCCTATPMSRC